MRIVFLSDLHSKFDQLKEIPEGDVIVVAGDFSSMGYIHEVKNFINWFDNLDFEYKIFIAGNHDFLFEEQPVLAKAMLQHKNMIYLEDSELIIDSLKFYGTPVSKPFFNWAFMKNDERRKMHFENIPDDVDILITHDLPYGILDKNINNSHIGCPILLKQYTNKRINPLIHVFGHGHGGYGLEQKFKTLFINASILDERYYIKNKPIVVEVDKNKNIKILEI